MLFRCGAPELPYSTAGRRKKCSGKRKDDKCFYIHRNYIFDIYTFNYGYFNIDHLHCML